MRLPRRPPRWIVLSISCCPAGTGCARCGWWCWAVASRHCRGGRDSSTGAGRRPVDGPVRSLAEQRPPRRRHDRMINSSDLLSTLQGQLRLLLDDLRGRVETEPSVGDPVRAEYNQAFDAERTAWTFTEWSEDRLTQVAVGWLLACVFVRFGEDNGLIDDALIAGTGARGAEARAAQQDYFRTNPHGSDRDFLHHAFRNAAALPGLSGVLGEGHSSLSVSYTHLRAHETVLDLVCRLLLEKKNTH